MPAQPEGAAGRGHAHREWGPYLPLPEERADPWKQTRKPREGRAEDKVGNLRRLPISPLPPPSSPREEAGP
eukprot:3135845-Pyramimonas_sp.AAC.1